MNAAAPGARFASALDRLAPDGPLAVAVSGGPDSLALLLLAHRARPGRVMAATIDHGLRAEARDEAAMVARVCADLGVAHRTLTVTVADDPAGLQAAARAARYAALAGWAGAAGAGAIATAHHRGDQAETVLMRLARGAGVAGLSGIRPTRALAGGVTLIRPLIDWDKAELIAIVAAAGLVAADDPSNRDPRFDRTRARVLLAQGWPASERIAASAARLGQAETALDWSARQLIAARTTRDDDTAQIDAGGLPREYARRLLIAGIAALAPAASPRGDEIDRLLDRLEGGHISTLGGIRIAPGPPWALRRAAPHRGK